MVKTVLGLAVVAPIVLYFVLPLSVRSTPP
jgi:hypothetical protein